jgi:hypothetical protein
MKRKDKLIPILLFLVAFLIRLYGISAHSLFADEITWMVRGKELFFALKQANLNYFINGYWLNKDTTWPIAMPMSLLSGTIYTINYIYDVRENPEYVVVETYSSQKNPKFEASVVAGNYGLIKEIVFRDIKLAKIYTRKL